VKIRFIERDPRVVPDMAAKVAFLERELAATERKPVPAVPKSALLERDGAKYVFVVKDGRAQRVKLDGGRALGDLVQADGLTPGERVIVKPPERLADGARVK
jgi:multidrug efflux pump subunit AcrA (membrane-fusion protein)